MERIYDVAVVGLGPSGATLARLIAKDFDVIAIDKKSKTSDTFTKPCGGLLADDSMKVLARFGLNLPKDILVDPQIFSVKTIDLDRNITRFYQRSYLNLDRARFDRWLISLIPDNVDVRLASTVVSVKKISDVFEVKFLSNDVEERIYAKYVIGADGANSKVAKDLKLVKKIKTYISIQEWYEDTNVRPFYSCLFSKDITDCYSWSISKDKLFIIGGAFPKKHCDIRFDLLKLKCKMQGFVFDSPLKREACLVLRPTRPRSFNTGSKGAFLLGEAAGFISPSSLEGISYALFSAAKLASALKTKKPNRSYGLRTFTMKLKLLLKNIKVPFMYNPLVRYLVMRSKINSIDVDENSK